jgi:hypothetical protein
MAEHLIASALNELTKARVAFKEADERSKIASSAQTEALNRLNRAQQAFDAAVEEERKNPPWNSNWARAKTKGERCEA